MCDTLISHPYHRPSPSLLVVVLQVHGGLLGVRGNPTHETQMAENGIGTIDLVILNLYAFEHTVAKVTRRSTPSPIAIA